MFLPPLLYAAAWESSYYNLRRNVRSITLLSVGLVLVTTFGVGLVAHLIVPGLPLPAAFALRAIVAPPDAVAAVSVARRLGLPRRTVTILTGESLFNDATALTLLRVAVAAAVGEGFSLLSGVGEFLFAAAGGVVVGLVLGPPIHWLRIRLRDSIVENAIALLVPFAAYLVAEAVHVSGVLAVVVAGLYLGHRSVEASFANRLQAGGLWKVTVFVLESIVFALIGLQLKPIMSGLAGREWTTLAGYALAVFATVVAARFAGVFAAAYLPQWLSRRIRSQDAGLTWRPRLVVSWAGMRGVVSLAAAFSVPLERGGHPFPARDLILFLTLCVVLGTLLLQGLTFPFVIRRLGVHNADEVFADDLAEAGAQYAAIGEALERLDSLGDGAPSHIVERLRLNAEHRRLGAWERLGGGTGHEGDETPSAAYRRLRRAKLAAERDVLLEMRRDGRIDDEVARRAFHELDLEEAMLARD